jgi:hypothetical protein
MTFSTYHEGDNNAEQAEAEGGHEESHVLILLLRTQKITWHCALRMRDLKVPAMSMEFRAILIICVAKFSTFVFFLQSEFGDAKLVSFFADYLLKNILRES